MFTFAQFISRDSSGEYYGTEVVCVDDAAAIYRRTSCGFGGDYPTRVEAENAATAWKREMQSGQYAAR